MARSQHTLQHKWYKFSLFIQGHQNSKSNAYRTARNRRCLLMLLGWNQSSPCNPLLLTQYRWLKAHPIQKNQKERRTITRPIHCRIWATMCCAGKVREGFVRRDLWRTERSDAWRCSVGNRGQQRYEDKATSQHCVPSVRGWVPRISTGSNVENTMAK